MSRIVFPFPLILEEMPSKTGHAVSYMVPRTRISALAAAALSPALSFQSLASQGGTQ